MATFSPKVRLLTAQRQITHNGKPSHQFIWPSDSILCWRRRSAIKLNLVNVQIQTMTCPDHWHKVRFQGHWTHTRCQLEVKWTQIVTAHVILLKRFRIWSFGPKNLINWGNLTLVYNGCWESSRYKDANTQDHFCSVLCTI